MIWENGYKKEYNLTRETWKTLSQPNDQGQPEQW